MTTRRIRHQTSPLSVESVQRIPGIRRITARSLNLRHIQKKASKKREDMLLVAVLSCGVLLLLAVSFAL